MMRIVIGRLRAIAGKASLTVLCAVSARFSRAPSAQGLHRTRVFGGPLRGMHLLMPTLERPSFALGTYEQQVVNALRARLRPGMVAYDVGAHIGYVTLAMARSVGVDGMVCAFEAAPDNARALRLAVRENAANNVRVVERAVSARSEAVTFATYGYSLVAHVVHEPPPADARLSEVQSTTLDEHAYVTGPVPHLIKVDVAGGELQVLAGAERTLREARPVLMVEVRRTTSAAVREIMAGHRYREQAFHNGGDGSRDGGIENLFFVPAEAPESAGG